MKDRVVVKPFFGVSEEVFNGLGAFYRVKSQGNHAFGGADFDVDGIGGCKNGGGRKRCGKTGRSQSKTDTGGETVHGCYCLMSLESVEMRSARAGSAFCSWASL